MRRLAALVVPSFLLIVASLVASQEPARSASRPPQAAVFLAAWPMPGHDPQHTFRSPVAGPQHPHLLFKRKAVEIFLIGPDGSMYGSAKHGRTSIPARFTAAGRKQATYPPTGAPFALLPTGEVAFGGGDNGTLALYRPNGRLAWRRTDVGLPKGSTPVVSADGHLYVPFLGHPTNDTSGLDVFRADGQRQRIEPGLPFFAVALAQGGTIYALTYNANSGESDLQALDPSGRLRWQRPFSVSLETAGRCRCLTVAANGGAYTADGNTVQAYDPTGHLAWSRPKADGVLTMAERADGSVLVAGQTHLDTLAPNGTLLWSVSLGTRSQLFWPPSLAVDRLGTTYVGTSDGHVLVIAASGKRIALLNAGAGHSSLTPTCLLDAAGRLVVNGADGVLRVYAETS